MSNLANIILSENLDAADKSKADRSGACRDQSGSIGALVRLVDVAKHQTGQFVIIAKFLLNLHYGKLSSFDMREFALLGRNLFSDCISVLRLYFADSVDLHMYISDGMETIAKIKKDLETE